MSSLPILSDAERAPTPSADIIDSVDVPIIAVGIDCAVFKFNPAAALLLSLTPASLGRTFHEIPLLANVKRLEELCEEAIVGGASSQCDVRDAATGSWFVLRVAPFLEKEQRIGGAVLTLQNVTAFRASLEQAIYEREYTKAIINTVIDPLVVIGDDCQVQAANQAFYTRFEVSREQAHGAKLYDIGTRDWDVPRLQSFLKEANANIQSDALEFEHEFPAIGRRIVLLNASRLAQRGNLGQLILLTMQDITERKQREEAVRVRTAQFETLLNEAPLGVYLVDADFRLRAANPTALTVFGNTADLIGRDFDELMHVLWPRAYADEIVHLFRRTLDTGEPNIVPERVEERLDSGVREYYEWQISCIPLPDGRDGAVCYFRDISRQVLAREAIAQYAERLRFMAESMPQKIFTAKANGDVDYFNRQWMDFTGLPFEEIRNWGWTQFVHPDDLQEILRLWQHSVETGEPFQGLQRFRRADGEYRWHLSRAHAMRDGDGKISTWIGSSTDIHQEKETEEQLRRANEDLNLFVFAASHDLQEPLRTITTYSKLLVDGYRGGTFDEKSEMFVTFIADGSKRMRELLADLLTYTALTAEREEATGTVDLNAVLGMVRENLKSPIEDSGAVISIDSPPYVHGLEAQLVQLFQNLISNAIKYRSASPLTVRIVGRRQKGEWCFEVADNGIGIDPEYHKKIFAVFQRLHGRKIPGSGVGLAICKRVVERHGGRIWVESQPGQGSTFYFTLPAGN